MTKIPAIKMIAIGAFKTILINGSSLNMINEIKRNFKKKEFLFEAYENSEVDKNIQIAGASNSIVLDNNTSNENMYQIKEYLSDTDIIVIVCKLTTPKARETTRNIVKIVKDLNIVSIALPMQGFYFEGLKRNLLAKQEMEKIKNKVNLLIEIPVEQIMNTVAIDGTFKDMIEGYLNLISNAICDCIKALVYPTLYTPSNSAETAENIISIIKKLKLPEIDFKTCGYHKCNTDLFSCIQATEYILDRLNMPRESISQVFLNMSFKEHPGSSDVQKIINLLKEQLKNCKDIIQSLTVDKNIKDDLIRINIIVICDKKNKQCN